MRVIDLLDQAPTGSSWLWFFANNETERRIHQPLVRGTMVRTKAGLYVVQQVQYDADRRVTVCVVGDYY